MAFEGPVEAEVYKLTVPSFFASSTTFGSLAAMARNEGINAPTPSVALIFSTARRVVVVMMDSSRWWPVQLALVCSSPRETMAPTSVTRRATSRPADANAFILFCGRLRSSSPTTAPAWPIRAPCGLPWPAM